MKNEVCGVVTSTSPWISSAIPKAETSKNLVKQTFQFTLMEVLLDPNPSTILSWARREVGKALLPVSPSNSRTPCFQAGFCTVGQLYQEASFRCGSVGFRWQIKIPLLLSQLFASAGRDGFVYVTENAKHPKKTKSLCLKALRVHKNINFLLYITCYYQRMH